MPDNNIDTNIAPGAIDTQPSRYDPAPSQDGGHTTVPSITPTEGYEDSSQKSDPRTAATADEGSGGSGA